MRFCCSPPQDRRIRPTDRHYFPARSDPGYALEANGRTGDALAAYLRAGELYEVAVTMLATMPDRDDNDISLHRIGGDVLMRVARMTRALAEGAPEEQHRHHQLETSYAAHRAYLAHSTSFARSAAAFPPSSQTAMHSSFRSLQALLSRWDPALVSLNDRTQERILRSTTRLPKAGETNRDYLRFLDEVVEGWKARGAPRASAGEVIEVRLVSFPRCNSREKTPAQNPLRCMPPDPLQRPHPHVPIATPAPAPHPRLDHRGAVRRSDQGAAPVPRVVGQGARDGRKGSGKGDERVAHAGDARRSRAGRGQG